MYVNESFILEKDDLYINFDKFESGESNICLITGLSGSGKSTLGKEISKKYNAIHVEIDLFFPMDEEDSLDILPKVFDGYIKKHKNFYQKIANNNFRYNRKLSIDILHYIIDYCKSIKNMKFAIEGIQIYMFGDESITEYPIVIKNTSALQSLIRMIKRDKNAMMEPDREDTNAKSSYTNLIKRIPRFLKYYIDDEKNLNIFRKKIIKEEDSNIYVNESFILEKDNLYINFDKFESGESNICLITGLSGSGKSTLGEKIAREYKAEYIELDLFEHCSMFQNDEQLKQAGDVFYKYFNKHKDIHEKIKLKKISNKELSTEISKFLKYTISYCKHNKNKKFIIEGVQIYSFGDESLKKYPMIFVQASVLKSIKQRWMRNGNGKIDWKDELKTLPPLLRWYVGEERSYNKFKKSILKEGGNVNLLETDLNSIVIFSTDILPTSVCEEYLNTKMDNDKFNTINAVERYLVIELSQLIKQSKLDKMRVNDIIDNRFKELMYNRNEEKERNLMFEIKQIKQVDLSYEVLEAILKNSIFNPNNILYLKTILNSNGDSSNEEYLEISLATKSFLKSMELIKYLAMKLDTSDERFLIIYNKIQAILYEFKDFYLDSSDFNLGTCNGIIKDELAPNIDDITSDDIIYIFDELKTFLINQVDYRLYYMINEFKCLSYRMEIRQQENNRGATLESFDLEKKYNDSIIKFENMDITEDGELDIIKLAEAYQLAHDICKYQYMQEADTKIITKGTNKITKAIGNASAKSRGMADAKSKIGAIKRGARIVDDRASDAINKKIDDIMNFSRDAKREKILTGKNTVRVSGVLKNAIKILVAGTAGVGLFGPIAGAVIGLIGVLGARGVSKNVEDREKKRILLELETELKIVKEKVEDAKGENNKKQKYQLMRIQANLEKEITRIKHGLRYY